MPCPAFLKRCLPAVTVFSGAIKRIIFSRSDGNIACSSAKQVLGTKKVAGTSYFSSKGFANRKLFSYPSSNVMEIDFLEDMPFKGIAAKGTTSKCFLKYCNCLSNCATGRCLPLMEVSYCAEMPWYMIAKSLVCCALPVAICRRPNPAGWGSNPDDTHILLAVSNTECLLGKAMQTNSIFTQ